MIHHPEKGTKKATKTGRFEREILCGACDGKLGCYEEIALKLLRQLRQRRLGSKSGGEWKIRDRTVSFKVPKNDAFVRFACGILWKYASTDRADPAHIALGRLAPVIEDVCFKDAEIPPDIDVFLERDLFQVISFDDPTDVFYYRTPSTGPMGKVQIARMAWFNVGGFTIYVRIDRRPSDIAPRRCWMAGKEQAQFVVSSKSFAGNIEMVASMREVQGDLKRLNPKLAQ